MRRKTLKEIVEENVMPGGHQKVPISEEEYLEFRQDSTPREILTTFRLLKSQCSKEFVKKHPHLFKSRRKSKK